MIIRLTKISDQEHQTSVERLDGSTDTIRLVSRSFLRHDFAHLAVEMEIPLRYGYWGSVANGASLNGKTIIGDEIYLAESLAGPVQTLIRIRAPAEDYLDILNTHAPQIAAPELAERIHARARQLIGRWRSIPYRDDMVIEWLETET